MNILCADDEQLALDILAEAVREAAPDAEIQPFLEAEPLLKFAREKPCDVAFLDIQMREQSGLVLAKRLKELNPKINIVFVTGYDQYTGDALHLRASGYVRKPATKEKILEELANLRHPTPQTESAKRVRVQCFGNFEIFVDGLPLRFARSQTKELLALLVDRNGAAMNTEQVCAVLWEEDLDIAAQKKKLNHLVTDLAKTLREANAENILMKRRNSFSILKDHFDCDYYDFLRGLPSGVNAYCGEYMSQYSWPEMTLGALA